MKKNYAIGLFAAAFLSAVSGCSNSRTEYAAQEDSRDIELSLQIPSGELACPLYIFRRQSGTTDEYLYQNCYESVANGSTLKIPLEDLAAFDYRFMMTAQPAATRWLEVKGNGSELTAGTTWSDIRIVEISDHASAEAYCGVTDMSGEKIIADGRINMLLKRIAGEMVFDLYRKGASLQDPTSIISPDVASVIDRVSRIDITYSNPTVSLRFGAGNELQPSSYGNAEVVQTIIPSMDAAFKVTLPQSGEGLEVYDSSVRGSLRMMGAFLLPSDSRVRVKMKFTYYDTTPSCGNTHTGDHVAGCFPEKTLTLNLPSASETSGLPVKSDYFTVNRACIRADRIIDIPTESSVDVDFTWK